MTIPTAFVALDELIPSILIHMSYATPENFTGEIVAGYRARRAYLAKQPALALARVQEDALEEGLGLKIFDSYRPAKAVAFFQLWAQREENNPEVKSRYYPRFSRKELFEQGYIAKQSSHSRGAAVDLTLVDLKSGQVLDMGSEFDFFDDLSHTDSLRITPEQRKNRLKLKELMEGKGFKNYAHEWWHYSFKPEPFPTEYFDFDVV